MTLDQYLAGLGFDPQGEEANRLIAWALDVDVEDLLDGLDDEEERDGTDKDDEAVLTDEEADEQILQTLKLCIDSDPEWRDHYRAFQVADPYEAYLGRLGIVPESPQELQLLEAVFGISFDDREDDESGTAEIDPHAPDDLPEISSEELVQAVHAFLRENPDWKPRA